MAKSSPSASSPSAPTTPDQELADFVGQSKDYLSQQNFVDGKTGKLLVQPESVTITRTIDDSFTDDLTGPQLLQFITMIHTIMNPSSKTAKAKMQQALVRELIQISGHVSVDLDKLKIVLQNHVLELNTQMIDHAMKEFTKAKASSLGKPKASPPANAGTPKAPASPPAKAPANADTPKASGNVSPPSSGGEANAGTPSANADNASPSGKASSLSKLDTLKARLQSSMNAASAALNDTSGTKSPPGSPMLRPPTSPTSPISGGASLAKDGGDASVGGDDPLISSPTSGDALGGASLAKVGGEASGTSPATSGAKPPAKSHDITTLQSRMRSTFETRIAGLVEDKNTLQQECVRLQGELDDRDLVIAGFKDELVARDSDITELRADNGTLQQECVRLQDELDASKMRIAELVSDLGVSVSEITRLEDVFDQQQGSMDQALAQYTAKHDQAVADIERLTSVNQVQMQELQEYKEVAAEMHDLLDLVETLTKENNALKSASSRGAPCN